MLSADHILRQLTLQYLYFFRIVKIYAAGDGEILSRRNCSSSLGWGQRRAANGCRSPQGFNPGQIAFYPLTWYGMVFTNYAKARGVSSTCHLNYSCN